MTMCKRFKLTKLSVGLVVFGYVCYYVIMATMPVRHVFKSDDDRIPCSLPSPDPFDPSIKKFFWIPEPLTCDPVPSLVYVDEFNTLKANISAFEFYKIRKAAEISCNIRQIVRRLGDHFVDFSDWVKVPSLPVNLTTDFNHVICKTKGGHKVFDNIVHGISRKKVYHAKQIDDESDIYPSVLMFGGDSMSRSATIRSLPKTRQYLDELGAYDFKGFMKVGENTHPNLIPLLTGKIGNRTECPNMDIGYFDEYPLLWKNFSARNYATLHAEDMPHLNFITNVFKGLYEQSTDHYMRPFWLAMGVHDTIDYKLSNIFRFMEDKGLKMGKTSVFCNQNTPNHKVLINYVNQFLMFYKDKRKFAFAFLDQLAHSFINFLGYGDQDFADFFKWLKTEGFLENTLVIFFSDHGSRFENLRSTFVGRIESRMPVLSIIFPDKLKRKYPKVHQILQENTNRLVTPYDIRQTLLDVVSGNIDNPSKQIANGRYRGISLFQPISEHRSCYDAWIPEMYCACYKSLPVDIESNIEMHTVALKIVAHLNGVLADTKQCQKLTLSKVLSAEELSFGLKYASTDHNGYSWDRYWKPESNRRKYSISIETVPGNARFEATCEITSEDAFKVIGDIERTNLYGNQSHCVTDPVLRTYCYCAK